MAARLRVTAVALSIASAAACSDGSANGTGGDGGDGGGGAGPTSVASTSQSSSTAASSSTGPATCETSYEPYAGAECGTCTAERCCDESKPCAPGSPCDEALSCYYDCPFSDTSCWMGCKQMPGNGAYATLAACQAERCTSECWLEDFPICDSGLSVIGGPEDEDCAECVSEACCAAWSNCFDSDDCTSCYVNLTPTFCDATTLDEEVATCVTTSCSAECDG